MAFGAEIKKLREDAGISVDKLTALIGVKAGRWRKWEEKDFDPRDEDRAKEDTLTNIKNSLEETRASALTSVQNQDNAMVEIRRLFSQIGSQKKNPSRGVGKVRGGTG
jgi:hypothetical protein